MKTTASTLSLVHRQVLAHALEVAFVAGRGWRRGRAFERVVQDFNARHTRPPLGEGTDQGRRRRSRHPRSGRPQAAADLVITSIALRRSGAGRESLSGMVMVSPVRRGL